MNVPLPVNNVVSDSVPLLRSWMHPCRSLLCPELEEGVCNCEVMLDAFTEKQCSVAVFFPNSVLANGVLPDATVLADRSVKDNELVLCR